MAGVAVTLGTRTYDFVPDAGDLAARRTRAIVRGRLVDELTNQPPRGPVIVTVAEPGLSARVVEDGLFGVVGRPWLINAPSVVAAMRVTLSIRAAGFLPIDLALDVPFDRTWLTAPAALNSTTLMLHDAHGLSVGQSLLLDRPAAAAPLPASADIQELAEISAVDAGTGQVIVRGPLRYDHPQDSVVVPDAFRPIDLDLELHREPVAIVGRTLGRDGHGNLVTVQYADVVLTEFWAHPVPANATIAPVDAALVALNPPLGADWPTTTTQIAVCDLPVDPTITDKHLRAAARAGEQALALSDLDGLAIDDVLIVDGEDDARVEFVHVQSLLPGTVSPGPGRATLERPLIRGHRVDARVSRADAQPPGAQTTFASAARAGDPCVFVGRPSPFTGTHSYHVRLSVGGAPPFAYHRLTPAAVRSVEEGWYRLAPITRAGQVTVQASKGAALATVTFLPDYTQAEDRLDLVFP